MRRLSRAVIIVPVYYREHLAKTIKSVLANDFDVILVNDSDVPLIYEHRRVTIIDNGRNMGVGASRDRGVRVALERNYDLIGFVDSDSVLSKQWRSECEKTLSDPEVLGVSGLALNPNQRARIARVKFVLKDYGLKRGVPFQIDCSLFRPEAFRHASFGGRKFGEDAYFIRQLDQHRLRVNKNAISYHHEVDSIRIYFRKEILGALYSVAAPVRVAHNLLLTPWTCVKMLMRWRENPDYPFAALVWLLRQIVWNMAYVLGHLTRDR